MGITENVSLAGWEAHSWAALVDSASTTCSTVGQAPKPRTVLFALELEPLVALELGPAPGLGFVPVPEAEFARSIVGAVIAAEAELADWHHLQPDAKHHLAA
jgi:hypothetical protein